MTLTVGARLGRYEIRSKIGEGGMGEVYLARDTQLDRNIALKILPAEVAQDQQLLRRFLQEASAASALSHPNVAHIYEIGEAAGSRFIAMEYVDGVPLDKKISGHPLPITELLHLAIQIADALDEAHTKGITHRDIKPANIMITARGGVKVLDFGLAKLAQPTGPTDRTSDSEVATQVKTNPGVVMGTVNYMSPEQALGRDVDHRTDLFSFGVVLYEMTTGGVPFSGSSLTDTIDHIAHAQPQAIGRLNYDAPAELEVIVKKALRKNRDERYQTAHDLRVDLQDLERELDFAVRMEHLGVPATGESTRAHSEQATQLFTTGQLSLLTASEAPIVPTQVSSAEYLTREIKRHKKGIAIVLGVMLIAAIGLALGLYRMVNRNRLDKTGVFKVTPLTSFPGRERNVAFSPDGRQVAFVWTGEKNDTFALYVKLIGAGEPLRLTNSLGNEMSPAWSPDGRYIAFLRGRGEGIGFYLIPAMRGVERKLADAYRRGGPAAEPQSIDWSPDGKVLAVVDKTSEDEPWSIFLLSVDTGEKHRLTQPPPGNRDFLVAFSPDGSQVAFARNHTFASDADIYTVPVTGGQPVRITSDAAVIHGLAWTPDGASLIVSLDRGGDDPTLWRMPATGGTPTLIAGIGENVFDLSVARQGDRLAYARQSVDWDIHRLELTSQPGGRRGAGTPVNLISSTRQEEEPEFSPDGRKIAFMSNRSGSDEIWVSDAEGKSLQQLTNFGGPHAGPPSWSPDGHLIVFTSLVGGSRHIYVVGAEGGSARRLTTDPSGEGGPRWSRDGRWIYFNSNRSGRTEVWKTPAAGGAAVELTREGGQNPAESPDGHSVYYVRGRGEPGLWQVSTEGGEETRLVESRVRPGNWAMAAHGIYLLTDRPGPTPYTLEFFDFTTRQTTPITTLQGPAGTFQLKDLTVSPDEHWVLYAERDKLDFDLMLVENFR